MTDHHAARRRTALATFALLTAAACIGVPAWQLIGPGPFDWHIRQPAFVQGGGEALALLALVATGCALGRRWALLILAALPLAFYLRRHAVDMPLLIDVVYLEIVIGLGAGLRRVCRVPPPADARGYLQAFVLGFLLWSAFAWSLSAFDLGSIKALRGLTLLLALPAACARHTPFALYLWRRLRLQGATDRGWGGALAAWIAVLYARSNVVFGHDSQWYGLRSEYVLAPGDSVFEPLGLVSPVYYFPKLYETFLLPVSALGDTSVIVGMTIGMLVLLLLACHVLADRIGLPPRTRWPVLALVATLPALAYSALEPKPDVITVLFVLLAADAALAFVRSRATADLSWLLVHGGLACVAKLTALPFVGALLLATMAAAWHERATTPPVRPDTPATRLALAAATLGVAVASFVTTRTWLLAGMPTIGPDPLFRLWSALGLSLTAPVGTLTWAYPQNWADVPALLVDWLFRPQRLPHVVTAWVGNVWLWCAVLALVARPWRRAAGERAPSRWPLAALLATGLFLAVAIGYHSRGGDGNYFLAALLPAILLGASAAFTRLAAAPRVFALALGCLPAFALFQAAYTFASAGWATGTRTFDLVLDRNWHDTRRLRWDTLERAGLARIGAYLKQAPGVPRAVGYAAEPESFWLPARFEHLQTIRYSRPEYIDDAARFLNFLRTQRIDYLILPKSEVPQQQAMITPAVRAAVQALEADPAVRHVDDRDYVLLDLSARRHESARAVPAQPSPAG